jgi:hypothetical protein
MALKAKTPKLHNNFRFVVRDVEKNEIVQEAYAYNIVLDTFFTTIMNTVNYTNKQITKIQLGRGTGELSASRTSLFSAIGYLSASLVESQISMPICSYKFKTTVGTTTYVGETFTEVGLMFQRYYIPNTSYTLVTHALLVDSEGNPISIGPKTDTQVIEIFVNAYMDMSTPPGDNLEWLDPNWFKDVITNDCGALTGALSFLPNYSCSVNPSNKVVDNGLKTITYTFARLQDTVGNYPNYNGLNSFDTTDMLTFSWANLFKGKFPNHDIFPPFTFAEQAVGSGDGSNKFFNFESGYFIPGTEVVKVDGVIKTRDADYIAHPYSGARQVVGYTDILLPGASEYVEFKINGTANTTICTTYNKSSYVSGSTMEWNFKRDTILGGFFIANYTTARTHTAEYSDDGINWTPVTMTLKTEHSVGKYTYEFPPTKCRYFKVTQSASDRIYNANPYGWGSIEFINAPDEASAITASWQTEYPVKNENIAYDISAVLQG